MANDRNERLKTLLKKVTPLIPAKGNQSSIVLVAIILSFTLWFLVTINQEYDTSIEYPVKITGVPETIQIVSNIAQNVEVVAHGGGLDLLVEHFKIRRDTLEFPFLDEYLRNGYIPTINFRDAFTQEIPYEVRSINPGRIYFKYEKKIYKRVPLVLKSEIRLKPAFQLISPPRLLEDSVIILGAKTQLDSITEWYTTEDQTELVTGAGEISVDVVDTIPGLTVTPKKVSVAVNPGLFTQAILKLPVEITDVPEQLDVRLNSKFVNVDALVPMENYNEIMREYKDMKLSVSFYDLNPEIPFFVPQPQLPPTVKMVGRRPFELHYVIVSK